MNTKTLLMGLLPLAMLSGAPIHAQRAGHKKPNILFVIMDDVGIDQMKSFGYGGIPGASNPDQANQIGAQMPNIDAVAAEGIRFRNTWSMPECSPGRAVMFTGRYPLRSNILQAIGPRDLNNSQVATWEMTTPKLLKEKHYTSAMFGKFHLGGPENNQFGDGAPASLGWNYFYGWTAGLPAAIDTTAGGVGIQGGPQGTYSCGFVPKAGDVGGANSGACYIPDATSAHCEEITGVNAYGDSAGLQCLTQGGVLVPNAACQSYPPESVAAAFNTHENAHYVSPLVINRNGQVEEIPLRDRANRGFRATIEVNAAIKWINRQESAGKHWMATVSFSADHTPLQPPPGKLLSPETRAFVAGVVASGGGCTTPGTDNNNVQLMSNALTEAMDSEFGRLLVETGIAHYNNDGSLDYNPDASNTMIVIVGDNGSLGSTVKVPFDPSRAKATAYQTGAWVPLIVSGPMVVDPGRDVNNMVNVADLFELFGEVAGINVKQAVPRHIDSHPLLPYLTTPGEPSLRHYNFTQGGFNIQANGTHNPPCVVPFPPGAPKPPGVPVDSRGLCSQVPVSKSVCEDNYGIWWGPGADPESTFPGFQGVDECWQVNQALFKHFGPSEYAKQATVQLTEIYSAVRDSSYKIVKNHSLNYSPAIDGPVSNDSIEFYQINEDPGLSVKLDLAKDNLIPPCSNIEDCQISQLSHNQKMHWDRLKQKFISILASAPACPGDGNGDGVVDNRDVEDWAQIATEWGGSSHYDFNHDGLTNLEDYFIIEQHLHQVCPTEESGIHSAGGQSTYHEGDFHGQGGLPGGFYNHAAEHHGFGAWR